MPDFQQLPPQFDPIKPILEQIIETTGEVSMSALRDFIAETGGAMMGQVAAYGNAAIGEQVNSVVSGAQRAVCEGDLASWTPQSIRDLICGGDEILPPTEATWVPASAADIDLIRDGLIRRGVEVAEDADQETILNALATWRVAEGLGEGAVMDLDTALALMDAEDLRGLPQIDRGYQPEMIPIQDRLIAEGFMSEADLGDNRRNEGWYGTTTRGAVVDFQRSRQLPGTGILDEYTLAALFGGEVVTAEADGSAEDAFITQRHPNPDNEDVVTTRFNDCGPSTVLAVMRWFGVEHPELPGLSDSDLDDETRTQGILDVREEMTGETSDETTDLVQASTVLNEAGLSTERMTNGNLSIDEILAILQNGQVVILAGQVGDNSWTPGEFVGPNASHIVAAVAYDPESGLITLLDPSLTSPITIPPEALQNFRDNDSGNGGTVRIVSAPPQGIRSNG